MIASASERNLNPSEAVLLDFWDFVCERRVVPPREGADHLSVVTTRHKNVFAAGLQHTQTRRTASCAPSSSDPPHTRERG